MSELDEIDRDLLEPVLQQMVELIGLAPTMAVVERYGGTLLNIPRQADRNADLVALMGAEKAAILGRQMGPDRLLIPKAGPALTAARNRRLLAMLATHSVRQVARQFGLGERRVWQIKAELGEPETNVGPGLFD